MTATSRPASETERELRLALDSAELGMWRHDLTTGEVHLDDRAREHFGLDSHDVRAEELLANVHPDDAARVRRRIAQLAKSGPEAGDTAAEIHIARAGKAERWLAIRVRVTEEVTPTGETHRVGRGTSHDVTERVRRERELRDSREFLDSIIEHSPIATWISDEHGLLLRCNQALRDLLHLTDEQIVGKYNVFEDSFVIEQGFMPLVHRVYEAGERIQFTLTWDSSIIDGVAPEESTYVVLIVTISPVVDEHGHVTNAIIQHIDITEQVRKENELRHSERRLADIIEFLPDATMVIDKAGTLIAWNRAMEELTNTPKSKVIGHGHDVYSPPFWGEARPTLANLVLAPIEEVTTWYADAQRTGDMLSSERKFVDDPRLGTRDLWASAAPLYDADGEMTGAIETIRDISERAQVETALKDSQRRLADIIEFLPDAAMVIDKDRKAIAWNRAMEELTGVSKSDVLGRGNEAYAIPFWGEPRPLLVDLVLMPTEDVDKWYEMIRRDGDMLLSDKHFADNPYIGTRDLSAKAAPLFDSNGDVAGAVETIRDISERKEAEAALQDSERRLTDIIEFFPSPAMAIDTQGIVIVWNRAMEELTGVPKSEMLGRGDHAYAVPFYDKPRPLLMDLVLAPQQEIDKWYDSVTRRGNMLSTDSLLRTKSPGEDAYTWAIASPLYNAQGDVVGAIEAIRDMTERARVEAALRESESKYRSLFENSLDGCAVCEMVYENGLPVDWIILDANPAFTRHTGLLDPAGKPVTELVPGLRESNPELLEIHGRVAAGGAPESFEAYLAPLGIWIAASAHSPAEGLFVMVLQNITERKQAEIALRESEKGLREAEAVGHLGHWVSRFSDGSVYWSDELFRMVGREPGSEVPPPGTLAAFAHPDDADLVQQYQRDLVEHGRAEIECRIMRADGTVRDAFGRGFLTTDADGVPQTFGVLQDITERKQVERELRRLTVELEERVQQRTAELRAANAELEAFSYSVSHDLRAPLRHVSGYTELLERRYGEALDEQAHHYMTTILRSAQGMGTLIDDLLTFSRAGRAELKRAEVDMDQLVREVLESLESTCAGRTIHWHIASLPMTWGDQTLLRQVWANLLGNAVKYSRTREEADIAVDFLETDDEYEFLVRDNGVGFDMEYADKLFGVFQRLHTADQFEGTGIGLANVRRIVTRLGGCVWAEAAPDEGATFHFSLPKRKETE